jgi:hypothetical protein
VKHPAGPPMTLGNMRGRPAAHVQYLNPNCRKGPQNEVATIQSKVIRVLLAPFKSRLRWKLAS